MSPSDTGGRDKNSRRKTRLLPSLDGLEARTLLSVAHANADAADVQGRVTGVRALKNVVYLNQNGRQEHLDLYVPQGQAPAGGWPAVLALAGGGWRWIRRSALGDTVSTFAKNGYVVAVADYAFAGNHPGGGAHVWPTDFSDVQNAVRWLRKNDARFGINPNKIAAWGESSGGNLAALLGTYPDTPATLNPPGPNPPGFADGVSARVDAVIDFYGPSDITALYNENPRVIPYLETFLGGTPSQVPGRYEAASPIDHVAPGDPPMLIFQGTADRAVPFDTTVRFDQALEQNGVPHMLELFPGATHGFRLHLDAKRIDLRPTVLSFLNQSLNSGA